MLVRVLLLLLLEKLRQLNDLSLGLLKLLLDIDDLFAIRGSYSCARFLVFLLNFALSFLDLVIKFVVSFSCLLKFFH